MTPPTAPAAPAEARPAGRGPEHVLPLVRRLKARLAQAYGERLAGVLLYGSYARGEAGPDSDVDLLVLLHGDVDPRAEADQLLDAAEPLERETGALLSMLASSLDVHARSPRLFHRLVRAEGILA